MTSEMERALDEYRAAVSERVLCPGMYREPFCLKDHASREKAARAAVLALASPRPAPSDGAPASPGPGKEGP